MMASRQRDQMQRCRMPALSGTGRAPMHPVDMQVTCMRMATSATSRGQQARATQYEMHAGAAVQAPGSWCAAAATSLPADGRDLSNHCLGLHRKSRRPTPPHRPLPLIRSAASVQPAFTNPTLLMINSTAVVSQTTWLASLRVERSPHSCTVPRFQATHPRGCLTAGRVYCPHSTQM